ncbi:hypothetical protein RND61_02525 [Streptomyces sp. TRM76323]|uniref:Uncharacterized protein n=1 Tax=Streptomyces tamarix TaxID=3078565 RepID=A0ABU3QDY5_9ACTN|nr:hypothetical protein [Streptomyces tamarix]MDT9680969.1 hypothetical protein [Streptomyces tamarix]
MVAGDAVLLAAPYGAVPASDAAPFSFDALGRVPAALPYSSAATSRRRGAVSGRTPSIAV